MLHKINQRIKRWKRDFASKIFEYLNDWIQIELCDGCGDDATHYGYDSMVWCDKCWNELIEEGRKEMNHD